ncbi:DUF488 family protein [Streptomyces sp. SID8379]|uniref:DUF488 domain-containing protein n=1 Tax=unclassified Streptomyces TaxID=2593676 RepID=UPI00035D17BA|nr:MULTISPECIES: DUF488 family protein [unclassified Streptomyces]MYW66876.1 DUF488 family protein [Streptomyces sp. SID8379]
MSSHQRPDPYAVRRVYDPPAPADGTRVLVDRLWPRGISKERAAVDEWLKDIAPSKELRTWYHENRDGRYDAFAERYDTELAEPVRAELVQHVRKLARHGRVTLVTSVKEIERSHVPVLVRHLRGD